MEEKNNFQLNSFICTSLGQNFRHSRKKQGDHRHCLLHNPMMMTHCRPIMWLGKRKKSPNNYGTRSLRDIFPVQAPINVDTTIAAQTSKLESEDDCDEVHKKMATRSVSTASTAFAAANATTTEESSEDDDDVDLINYTSHIPSRY